MRILKYYGASPLSNDIYSCKRIANEVMLSEDTVLLL